MIKNCYNRNNDTKNSMRNLSEKGFLFNMKKLTKILLASSLLLMQVTPVIAQDAETPADTTQQEPSTGDSGSTNPGTTEPNPNPTPEQQEPTTPEPEPELPSDPEPEPDTDPTPNPTPTPNPDPVVPWTPPQTWEPTTPPNSNNPDDYGETTPVENPLAEEVESTENIESEESEEVVEVEEELGLLEGPYVAFNANIFLAEEDADNFIQMIEEDPEAGDRFVVNKINNENGSVIVTVEYAEDVEEEGRNILLYVETGFETEEEAAEYGKKYLTIMPDLFFDGEVFEVDGKFNVVFGIRHTAKTLAFDYDSENEFEIVYNFDREPFTYTVRADETGSYNDPIPVAIAEAYPGEFTFDEVEIEPGVKEVTMTPVPQENGTTEGTIEEVEGTDDSEQ